MKVVRDCRGRLDEVGVALAKVWREEGLTLREIGRRLRHSPTSVATALARGGVAVKRKPPTVCRTKLKKRRHLVKKLVKTLVSGTGRPQFPSTKLLARELTTSGMNVSASTVRRDLLALGFRARKRPKAPARIEGDAARRLAFCRQASPPNILFSDEKMFDCNDHGAAWQWCQGDQPPQKREFSKFSPKVHVWGLIGVGVKELVIFKHGVSVNAPVYKRFCLSVVSKVVSRQGGTCTFMQDNARPHVAGESLRYLQNKGISVLGGWPARSPDLNPIENLWAILAQRVSHNGPKDAQQLEKFILKCWAELDQNMIDKLVQSFDGRKQQVIRNRGH